ncbi:hypothetical protein GCM10023093_16320 [Nemorincola caseinilytica]|uniref:Beta-lactamase-related domain-containing protein n=1 Tax=Nemorincola caseinilytica TaxID=2054315 RepID=A0ABP8NCB0_9BACT
MYRLLFSCSLFLSSFAASAQATRFADSIQKAFHIPALAYAVVSADSVYELHVAGVRKLGTRQYATPADRFRIGSNTKAVTGLIAAILVKDGKIKWDTRFFDLFPEMRPKARKEYHHLTLLDLLTFRTKLFRYTYTDTEPAKDRFEGSEARQRYQFTQWFFMHEPQPTTDSINFSNLGYIAAGLMLEKATGRSYEQLAGDLGERIGMPVAYGRPNARDSNATCGHDASLRPEVTGNNDHKLSWLLAAGNINCTLPAYVKFIQEHLRGMQGRSHLLSRSEFDMLLFGRSRFAVGWFHTTDTAGRHYAYNIGNPGTFLSKVYVFPGSDRAFIILTNAQTADADEGTDLLYTGLCRIYLH